MSIESYTDKYLATYKKILSHVSSGKDAALILQAAAIHAAADNIADSINNMTEKLTEISTAIERLERFDLQPSKDAIAIHQGFEVLGESVHSVATRIINHLEDIA